MWCLWMWWIVGGSIVFECQWQVVEVFYYFGVCYVWIGFQYQYGDVGIQQLFGDEYVYYVGVDDDYFGFVVVVYMLIFYRLQGLEVWYVGQWYCDLVLVVGIVDVVGGDGDYVQCGLVGQCFFVGEDGGIVFG